MDYERRLTTLSQNDQLVDGLVETGVLESDSIIRAFREIDRADFVPDSLRDRAYENTPLPIGHGQTISQPYTVAFMLELLDPQPGNTILDVGCGSGWQTALLSHIVSQHGKRGRVIGIERIPELADLAEHTVSRYSLADRGVCQILCQNAEPGLPDEAPFDGIIGAASASAVPAAWQEQVEVGGRIVLPVGSEIIRLEKLETGEFDEQRHPGFVFVPFVTD
ncbi:protein-L-isoaspartate O-methyltransferase [Candidatus Berkelbacteria bacterium]|nr:protein-L-isoaspartate O-methyltransferase [Candidatus Berkelbacteria bacterium]